ncbi:hypothetical protein ACTWP5_10560 [Streptomyces sp. 4N509B]|uniref:hypothetical protein n=1 Tax=Streptomyces sp. 4N509B TaxID=3457413 RepID=UPI003FCFF364
MPYKCNPSRGGHAPGHLRDGFREAVETAGFSASRTMRREDWTKLWDCTDILPGDDCALLDIPRGSTYAQAVRSLAKR